MLRIFIMTYLAQAVEVCMQHISDAAQRSTKYKSY